LSVFPPGVVVMRRAAIGRRGTTLTEVVAVIGIIGVMVSLIVPALVTARGAADRISCTNNLKQLILAIHNYENENGALPPGVVNPTGPVRNRPEGLHAGWIVQLLPYMEQRALAIDPSLSVYDPANAVAASSPIRILLCPSDPGTKPPGAKAPAASSYAGCHHDVEAPIDVDNHGVFFLNSHVRHEDIPDGSANTIFVGEKRFEGLDLGWLSGTRATLRNTGTPINAPPAAGAAGDEYRVGGFSSHHPGGANFAFGDGSIRFLSERIDPRAYRRLGHRADGELVGEEDLRPQAQTGNR
jgi:prepilin-type processing-associated H-X9-DG protein